MLSQAIYDYDSTSYKSFKDSVEAKKTTEKGIFLFPYSFGCNSVNMFCSNTLGLFKYVCSTVSLETNVSASVEGNIIIGAGDLWKCYDERISYNHCSLQVGPNNKGVEITCVCSSFQ